MFKLLFGRTPAAVVESETQRQVVMRALSEINEVLSGLDVKPKLSFDPTSGALELQLPEQMPDEAKALPAPSDISPEEAA